MNNETQLELIPVEQTKTNEDKLKELIKRMDIVLEKIRIRKNK